MQGCRLVVLLERGFDGSLREHGFERICGGNAGMPIGCVIGTRISADHFVNTDLNGFAAEMQGCRLVVLLEHGLAQINFLNMG
ncbi:hypothetical protein OX284_002305 [Flavobacterium sp. SUN046]|uniref:hypothetical protein n=1 Tax=Flavobacterium sp. SUN046 TaxID=3002440 RepID=UPI002DBFD99C|nr:hypothetical protein [Flavobacterium sp. SUN046]MEC4048248.1 hypothetical protein [Flavobacterium sp. SUN046]